MAFGPDPARCHTPSRSRAFRLSSTLKRRRSLPMWNRTLVTQVSREEANGAPLEARRQHGSSTEGVNNVQTNNRAMACAGRAGSKCSRLRNSHHRKMQTPQDFSRTSERAVSVVRTSEPATLKHQPSQPTHRLASSALRESILMYAGPENRGTERLGDRYLGWSQEEVRQWRDRPESVATTG